MGKRGPVPTPTALKILRGNPGRRPLPEDEPQVEVKKLKPPKELSKVAKKEWNRIVPELYNLGLIGEVDRTALIAYVEYWDTWHTAMNMIKKTGLVSMDSEKKVRINPYFKVANIAFQRVKELLLEFGLTPAARARIGQFRLLDNKIEDNEIEDKLFG